MLPPQDGTRLIEGGGDRALQLSKLQWKPSHGQARIVLTKTVYGDQAVRAAAASDHFPACSRRVLPAPHARYQNTPRVASRKQASAADNARQAHPHPSSALTPIQMLSRPYSADLAIKDYLDLWCFVEYKHTAATTLPDDI